MINWEDNVAMLTSTNTGVSVKGEVDNFRENQRFDAWIGGNKISMKWNGKTYVGKAMGMEFTSPGPKIN